MGNFFIETDSIEPQRNLAVEQYVFESLPVENNYIMLWQNNKSVIIGRNQNTEEQINSIYTEKNNINVVRRITGGGAVYHDLGNVNFSFIESSNGKPEFARFCEPLIAILGTMGVKVELSGRNDMTIDGKKFSGNAESIKKGRILHHGTILFDCDLAALKQALHVDNEYLKSKGIKSVESRVVNLRSCLKKEMTVKEFMNLLKEEMFKRFKLKTYTLSVVDLCNIQQIEKTRYRQQIWNYGSPASYDEEVF
jgi:lipoate-protein ligase A